MARQFTLCHGGQLGGKAALLFAGANTPTDFQFGSKPCPTERQKTFILIPSLLQSQSSGMHAMTSRDTREESSWRSHGVGWGGGAFPEALSSSRFEVAALRTQEVTQELLQSHFSEADLWEEGQASRTDRLQSWLALESSWRTIGVWMFSHITECID